MNILLALSPALEVALGVLAVAGGLGIVVRLGRSLARLGITAAEETAVSGLAEASARRGDLTAMAENRALSRALRRARFFQIGAVGAWAALLVVPPLAGWMPAGYAAAAVLWLLPRAPLRPARGGGGEAGAEG